MGCYDEVGVPCPKCGKVYYTQSKGGECLLFVYKLEECPLDVLSDVNRHAPFECDECGTKFEVRVQIVKNVVVL